MSVATLGFAVDSSQAVSATKALNGLTAAAKPAAQAAADLSKVSTASSTAMRAGTATVNDHAKAHAGLSTQAMAAQHSIRSMVEQLAMGIPPTQVLTGQLNHLSYAASGPGGLKGAFTEALGAFRSFLSPTTLVVGGLAAIAAGAAAAVISVAKLAEQFQDSARAAGTTVGQLQGFAAAASFKGISNADFLTSIDKFASSVYAAKNNMGGLADVLTANGKRAGDLVQDFGTISDLVKSAAGSTQLQFSILQQVGLPATMQWVRFLSQGKDAIAAQVAEFTKNGTQMDALAAKSREFQEAWDKAIANLKFGFQSAILSIAGFFDTLSDKATSVLMAFNNFAHKMLPSVFSADQTGNNILRNAFTNSAAGYQVGSKLTNATDAKGNIVAGTSIDSFYSPLGTNAPGNNTAANKPPLDPEVAKHNIALQQQQIGLLGDLATVEDRVKSAQLSLNAAALNHVTVSDKQAAAIINAARAQAEMNLVQQQASVGVFNLDAANKAAADTLQMWIDKHLLDPSNAEQMSAALTVLSKSTRDLSDAAKVAGSNLPGLQQAINDASNVNKQIDQFATSSFNNITTGLADIFDGTKSAAQGFSDLGKTILRTFEEAAIKALIVGPLIKAAFGGVASSGGLLSLLGIGGGASAGATTSAVGSATTLGSLYHTGGIVGSEPTNMRYIHPAYFDDAPRFHKGLLPDEFPAILQKGEGVFTRSQMAAMGGSTPNVSMNVNVVNNAGAKVTTSPPKRDSNGSMSIDVIVDQLDAALGQRITDGTSNTGNAIQSVHGLTRTGR